MKDGTAFFPVLVVDNDFIVVDSYYEQKKDAVAANKERRRQNQSTVDLRTVAKAGPKNCGFAPAACRVDLKATFRKRLNQLILHDKFKIAAKFHQSRFAGPEYANQQRIDLGTLFFFYGWDGTSTSSMRGYKSRTRCQIYFGGLEDGFACSPRFCFVAIDIVLSDKHNLTKKAMKQFVIEYVQELKEHTVTIQGGKTWHAALRFEPIGDLPALDGLKGALGFNSWCSISNIVLFDPVSGSHEFIDTLRATAKPKALKVDHVYSSQVAEALNGQKQFRVHIADVPGLVDTLKAQTRRLQQEHPVDYDNIPPDGSAARKRHDSAHRRRKMCAEKTLRMPFVRVPLWPLISSKNYDVLHFILVKSQHCLVSIADEIQLFRSDESIDLLVNVYLHSKLSASVGEQWQKLLYKKIDALHWTGPIARSAFHMIDELFGKWESQIADPRKVPMFAHHFTHPCRYMKIFSILSQHHFAQGSTVPKLIELLSLHKSAYFQDLAMLKKLKPYDHIGCLAITPMMIQKVEDDVWNHGLAEGSATKQENCNHYMKCGDAHNNGDWDQLTRSANESDLDYFEGLLSERVQLEALKKRLEKDYVKWWDADVSQRLEDLVKTFDQQTRAAIAIIRKHDFAKDTRFPAALTPFAKGTVQMNFRDRGSKRRRLR